MTTNKPENDSKEIETDIIMASKEQRNDKSFVLKAVEKDGSNLQYASKELRNDKEVVLTAIRQNVRSIRFVSQELVLVNDCGFAYLPDELREDKEFILKTIEKNSSVYHYLDEV